MKLKRLFLIVFILFFFFDEKSHAQANANLKYRIELPYEWKKRPRIIYKIAEIAPVAFREIQGLQLCVDCEARYKIILFIDEFNITRQSYNEKFRNIVSNNYGTRTVSAKYQMSTNYTVNIALRLVSNDDIPLQELALLDSGKIQTKNVDFTVTGYSRYRDDSYVFLDAQSYIDRHREELHPNWRDILNLAEENLVSLSVQTQNKNEQ